MDGPGFKHRGQLMDFLQTAQSSCGAHQASSSVDNGILVRGQIGWGVKFTDFRPVPRLSMSGVVPLLPPPVSHHGADRPFTFSVYFRVS